MTAARTRDWFALPLIALETSTLSGSIALARGREILDSRALPAERRRSGELVPALVEMCRGASLEFRDVGICAYSQGPGSFTGLRAACAIARMLKLAAGAVVIPVPSLLALAAAAPTASPATAVVALRDARRGEVFAQRFEFQGVGESTEWQHGNLAITPVGAPRSVAPRDWLATNGDGAAIICDPETDRVLGDAGRTLRHVAAAPDATVVAQIAFHRARTVGGVAAHQIVPLYVRPPECEEVYEQRRAAARARRIDTQAALD